MRPFCRTIIRIFVVSFAFILVAPATARVETALPDCDVSIGADYWNGCVGEHETIQYKFRGEFHGGLPNGYGEQTYFHVDGSQSGVYNGEFKNGTRHGEGTYLWANGTQYRGTWLNGRPNGSGVASYAEGYIYDGNVVEGFREGFGSLIFPSGNKWFGEWGADLPKNPGFALLRDGIKIFDANLVSTEGQFFIQPVEEEALESFRNNELDQVDILLPGERLLEPNYTDLFNQKGPLSAIAYLQQSLNSQTDVLLQQKILRNILLACLRIGDLNCFAKNFDKNADLIKLSQEAPFDHGWTDNLVSALLSYRELFKGVKEESIPAGWRINETPLDERDEYIAFRATIESRMVLLSGNMDVGLEFQRKALGLTFLGNLRIDASGISVVTYLENEVYLRKSTESLRRFLEACTFSDDKSRLKTFDSDRIYMICNTVYLDEYMYARLLYLAIFSNVLNSEETVMAKEFLHELYQDLDITDDSLLATQKESFYYLLWLESKIVGAGNLSFSPGIFFDEIKTLTKYKNPVPSFSLKSGMEDVIQADGSDAGKLRSSNYDAYNALFTFRAMPVSPAWMDLPLGISNANTRELKSFLKSFLREREPGEFINSIDALLLDAVLWELYTRAPNASEVKEAAYFLIRSENIKRNPLLISLFQRLGQAGDQLEKESLIHTALANANFAKGESDLFYQSVFSRASEDDRAAPSHEFVPNSPYIYDSYLRIIRQARAPKTETHVRDSFSELRLQSELISRWLNEGSTLVFAEATSSLHLSIVLVGDRVNVFISPREKNLEHEHILRSKELLRIDPGDIDRASASFSRLMFGANANFTENTIFLTGPTISNIPVTLLKNPRSDRWLLEDSIIRNYLSLGHAQYVLQGHRSMPTYSYVSFANPSLRDSSNVQSIAQVQELIRGSKSGLSGLAELPETEIESRAISKSIGGKQLIFTQENANIDNLMRIDFDDVSVLNFSTHAVLAGQVDEAFTGALVLSRTFKHNGLLNLSELRNIKGAPGMVFLSACNTGSENTNLDRSEIASIADVFMMKGTRGVLSSFWAVDSNSSVMFLEEVASNISNGIEMAEAVHLAARKLKNELKSTHPATWAAYVPTGYYSSFVGTQISERNSFKRLSDLSSAKNVEIESGGEASSYLAFYDQYQRRNRLFQLADSSHLIEFESPLLAADGYLDLTRSDKGALYIALSSRLNHSVYKVTGREVSDVCSIPRLDGYYLSEVTVSDETITYLFKNTNQDQREGRFSLRRQAREDCSVSVAEIKVLNEFSLPSLIPLNEGKVLLVETDSYRTSPYVDSKLKSDLGFQARCFGGGSKGKFLVLDDSSSTSTSSVFEDIFVINSNRLVNEKVLLQHVSPCEYRSILSFATPDSFNNPEEFNKYGPSSSNSKFLKAINEQFVVAMRVWYVSEADGAMVYVKGFPNNNLAMARADISQVVSDDTWSRFERMHAGVYVARFGHSGNLDSEKGWVPLISDAECQNDFSPMSFFGNPVFRCDSNILTRKLH